MSKFELVIALVNTGFSEVVMEAAKEAGARGGTVVHARGTAGKDISKKYGIVITPDKEMVLILVTHKIADNVVKEIYKRAGLATDGQGIVFTLPVDNIAGLKLE